MHELQHRLHHRRASGRPGHPNDDHSRCSVRAKSSCISVCRPWRLYHTATSRMYLTSMTEHSEVIRPAAIVKATTRPCPPPKTSSRALSRLLQSEPRPYCHHRLYLATSRAPRGLALRTTTSSRRCRSAQRPCRRAHRSMCTGHRFRIVLDRCRRRHYRSLQPSRHRCRIVMCLQREAGRRLQLRLCIFLASPLCSP